MVLGRKEGVLGHATHRRQGVVEHARRPGVLGGGRVAGEPVKDERPGDLVIPGGNAPVGQGSTEAVQHRRAEDVMADVILPGPYQLDGLLPLAGDLRHFLHVLLGQAPTEATAQEGGVHPDLPRGIATGTCRRDPRHIGPLGRSPDLQSPVRHHGGGVLGLHRRVRQEGRLVFRLQHLIRVLKHPGSIALAALGIAGAVIRRLAILAEDRVLGHLHRVGFVPLDAQLFPRLHGLPVAFRHHGNATFNGQHVDHTGQFTGPGIIKGDKPRADGRWPFNHGIAHALQLHVDAEAGLARDLGQSVQATIVLTDIAEVFRAPQRDLFGHTLA